LNESISSFSDIGSSHLTCSICLDDFKQDELVKCLPVCKHRFHEPCLKKWYETDTGGNGDTCPVCRRPFSKPIEISLEDIQFEAEQAYYAAVLGLNNDDDYIDRPPRRSVAIAIEQRR
jgi:hypothetical protein